MVPYLRCLALQLAHNRNPLFIRDLRNVGNLMQQRPARPLYQSQDPGDSPRLCPPGLAGLERTSLRFHCPTVTVTALGTRVFCEDLMSTCPALPSALPSQPMVPFTERHPATLASSSQTVFQGTPGGKMFSGAHEVETIFTIKLGLFAFCTELIQHFFMLYTEAEWAPQGRACLWAFP